MSVKTLSAYHFERQFSNLPEETWLLSSVLLKRARRPTQSDLEALHTPHDTQRLPVMTSLPNNYPHASVVAGRPLRRTRSGCATASLLY